MIRRKLYGWLRRPGEYCLGRNPPDSPSMPYRIYPSMNEAQIAAEARRATIIWCGDAAKENERIVRGSVEVSRCRPFR